MIIPKDWNLSTLGEITNEIYRYPTYFNIKYTESGIPEIRGELIKESGRIEEDLSKFRFISETTSKRFPRTILKENDFVLSVRGTIGKIALISKKFEGSNITANLIRISPNQKIIFPYFLKHYFLSEVFQSTLNNKSSQTTIKTIQAPLLKSIQIPVPKLTEQQKIASILSNVDKLIQKIEQIIGQSQRLKKGLMQRLLTKGIGHNKFEKVTWNYGKKIEIPKEWKVVFLDEVTQRGTGHTPDAKKPEYYNGGIKWVSLADSKRLDNIYISETTKEISEIGIKNSSAVKHPAGTVILSRDAGVGKSAILKTEMAVSQHFIAWRSGENLNNHFLYYLLQYWKPLFESIAIGTTIKTIGLPFFKKLRIPLPHINEQRKIAFFLLNIDELIQKLKKKKIGLEYLKKGLMQQLLTGKLRVKV